MYMMSYVYMLRVCMINMYIFIYQALGCKKGRRTTQIPAVLLRLPMSLGSRLICVTKKDAVGGLRRPFYARRKEGFGSGDQCQKAPCREFVAFVCNHCRHVTYMAPQKNVSLAVRFLLLFLFCWIQPLHEYVQGLSMPANSQANPNHQIRGCWTDALQQ